MKRFIRPFLTRRFMKFAAVGASGVIVNLGTLAVLRLFGINTNLASAAAIELSILSNFAINHLWTFNDRRGVDASVWQHGFRFHLVSLGGGLIQFVLFVAMNVLWLELVGSPEAIGFYSNSPGSFFYRWLWHPVVTPPPVGKLVYVSQIAGIGAATIWNYLLNFYWTWAASRTAAPPTV